MTTAPRSCVRVCAAPEGIGPRATFGDAAGKDTVLRSHWNNQATGIVADEVDELRLDPKNWGKISFE